MKTEKESDLQINEEEVLNVDYLHPRVITALLFVKMIFENRYAREKEPVENSGESMKLSLLSTEENLAYKSALELLRNYLNGDITFEVTQIQLPNMPKT